jgi:hypothetical protein
VDLTCHEILPVFWFTQDDQAIAKPSCIVNQEIRVVLVLVIDAMVPFSWSPYRGQSPWSGTVFIQPSSSPINGMPQNFFWL